MSDDNNNSPLFIWQTWWYSLPLKVREWTTKILVTLVLAVAWHWYSRPLQQQPPSNARISQQQQATKGVSRLVLDPLPQDLVLEERVEGEGKEEEENPTDDDPKNKKGSSPSNDIVDASAHEADRQEVIHTLDVSNHEEETSGNEEGAVQATDASDHNGDAPRETSTRTTARCTTTESSSSPNGRTLREPRATPASERPVFRNQSKEHPGLEGFWHWCDVECSLFRIYSLGRKDGTAVHPPFIPRSRRGQVKISLRVQNRTEHVIHVYWVDYKGREESKGKINPFQHWTQITWIEHPWVFRDAETDQILLYYIPDRIIPTCEQTPTVDEHDSEIGVHRFDLISAPLESPFWVHINDPVLPFPAKDYIQSPEQAVDWALLHMHRMNFSHWEVLSKYLNNILYEPANAKYRQIRLGNPTFHAAVWQTPAKGLLLALGFVEHGAYIELGTARRLTKEQVKQLSGIMFSVAVWKKRQDSVLPLGQPSGADGFGRAGFGRTGATS